MDQTPTLSPPTAARSITALMLREMAATYGRSPGGWLWAVAEPVAAIALLTFLFGLWLHAPPLGRSFALFYATGYLPFVLFTDISTKVAQAIRFSRPLLGYPALVPLDALAGRFLLNLLTQLIAFCVVLAGIEAIFATGADYDGPRLVAGLGLAALLAAGVGSVNCALFHLLPLWERLWQIATRPLFLVSGIFFLVEDVPAEFREIALWNPLLHLTALMRGAVYPVYDARLASPVYVAGFGLALLAFGLLLVRRYGREAAHG